jgi:hypothetical protein
MTNQRRIMIYKRSGRKQLTPAQQRRIRKHANYERGDK